MEKVMQRPRKIVIRFGMMMGEIICDEHPHDSFEIAEILEKESAYLLKRYCHRLSSELHTRGFKYSGLEPFARVSYRPPTKQWEYIPPQNPFSLSVEEFLSKELDEAKELFAKAYELSKDLLDEAWERGVRQVVICDGKIVFESRDIEDIPNETVEQIAREYNKACYVFSAPDVVEESDWTPVRNDDFYPTLCIYLGTEDLDEKEIIEESPIYPDLDTGNSWLKVFDARFADPLTRFTSLEMGMGEHLGQNYTYFRKRVKMCVKDINGNINSRVYNIRFVRDWGGSALLQVSPNRTGFIGRDVLRDLRIKIILDPVGKTTQIVEIIS